MSASSFSLWDIVRYIIAAVASGALIWFYAFCTPPVFVNKETSGETMETHYIVKVARFPESADWQKTAASIQDRLDALEQTMSSHRQDWAVAQSNALDLSALKQEIPELAMDMSALAKGFAVDSIAELLDEQKITDYMIEIGDKVRCKGKKTKDKDWIVGIEKPTHEFSGIQQTLALRNQSLAVSGTYRQTPSQGIGEDGLAAAAVVAPNCTLADAWASAMFVLGEQKGLDRANQHGVAVLLLLRIDNEIHEVPSNKWQK
jgi:thiamine biosynthesis lipoprotein ApbE